MDTRENKIIKGQFYTLRNPFSHPLVASWVGLIGDVGGVSFVEPFGGANNIIKLFSEVFPHVGLGQWKSYDIEPEAVLVNQVPSVSLIKRDTILCPVPADVVITNPPYLAKNSATRRKMSVDFGSYQDLYEVAVGKMLSNAKYVAAIIPESFLTRKLFRDRLFGFISITENLFDDTEFPVGLALWVPEEQDDFEVWVGGSRVGWYKDIKGVTDALLQVSKVPQISVVYNDPAGVLGLMAVDSTRGPSIRYVAGEAIDGSTIKATSRAITRISVLGENRQLIVDENNLKEVIVKLNGLLSDYRDVSYDLFLTSFKGLRSDGRYRRRLDWNSSNKIIVKALEDYFLAG